MTLEYSAIIISISNNLSLNGEKESISLERIIKEDYKMQKIGNKY